MRQNKQAGMTLIELTVVLLVLVALAGLAIPYVSGTSRKALCDATDVSMANIKRVIMERYYLDTLGYAPKDSKDLDDYTDYSLDYLFTKPGEWSVFDPDSQVGWRGPYLQGGLVLDASDISSLQSNFKSTTYVNKALATSQKVVLDGWGRPFILQVPAVADCKTLLGLSDNPEKGYCARLVSAGFGSGIGMGNADLETKITEHRKGGDRILYLNAPTPAVDINPSCAD